MKVPVVVEPESPAIRTFALPDGLRDCVVSSITVMSGLATIWSARQSPPEIIFNSMERCSKMRLRRPDLNDNANRDPQDTQKSFLKTAILTQIGSQSTTGIFD